MIDKIKEWLAGSVKRRSSPDDFLKVVQIQRDLQLVNQAVMEQTIHPRLAEIVLDALDQRVSEMQKGIDNEPSGATAMLGFDPPG